MAQDDFDVAGLANYLHMMPADVTKLANRGKLPGRRVADQWRFARAEIHHWLEDRIGLSDSQELVRMEGLLDRVPNADSPQDVCISDLLLTESIGVPLAARTKASAVVRRTPVMVTKVSTSSLICRSDELRRARRDGTPG